MTQASAPAKIILFGEHAVVYGEPAIAAPVTSLRAFAEVSPAKTELQIISPQLENRVSAIIDSMKSGENPLREITRLIIQRLECPPPRATITVRSDIPVAGGLGSGAAISTAIARALSDYMGQPLENEILNQIVYKIEQIYHGTPSGIDNTVIVYEKPIYYAPGQPVEFLEMSQPLQLIIGNTGNPSPTRIAVDAVRRLYQSSPYEIGAILRAIGQISRQAKHLIFSGQFQELGPLMSHNHDLLRQLQVSSRELDVLCAAAINGGALGAKLSGGGKGGNMIAMVTEATVDRVECALLEAGACQIIRTVIHTDISAS